MAEDDAHLGEHDGDGEAPPEFSAGIVCAPLLADARSWIRRRVETIDMLAHEETHRRVSIDFALSPTSTERSRSTTASSSRSPS
jgi:hypothetical protein